MGCFGDCFEHYHTSLCVIRCGIRLAVALKLCSLFCSWFLTCFLFLKDSVCAPVDHSKNVSFVHFKNDRIYSQDRVYSQIESIVTFSQVTKIQISQRIYCSLKKPYSLGMESFTRRLRYCGLKRTPIVWDVTSLCSKWEVLIRQAITFNIRHIALYQMLQNKFLFFLAYLTINWKYYLSSSHDSSVSTPIIRL